MIVPLPAGVRKLLDHNTHPGLLLDKYVPSWEEGTPPGKLSERVQKPAVRAIVEAARQPPAGLEWDDLLARRKAFLDAAGAVTVACETAGPLTLHLSRAGALENAGICLHPVYGFAYLPGSGLKGMARAYAEMVTGGPDSVDVLAVFGNKPGEPSKDRQRAGAIVFHDAWPLTWPRLTEDIVNNHHRDYYGARDGHNGNAPGDWEEPTMVSFLAVSAGVAFDFPLAKRRGDVDDRLLKLAREWLLGGLTHLGAGAKTAAGYGTFRARPAQPPVAAPTPSVLTTFETTLELLTPAFLAGPSQTEADCDLRPATLRGLLRWWWRTLHAGYVDVATLRRLEAAVWGSTKQGGAVRVTVEPIGIVTRLPFDKAFIARMNKLPPPPNNKTTQGLSYHSYGMDEKKGRRFFVVPGTKWRVRLVARRSRYPLTGATGSVRKDAPPLETGDVLAQAKAALWLLCHCGGVGSKSRKGFGSFDDAEELSDYTAEVCEKRAAEFRNACGLLPAQPFDDKRAETPAWSQRLPCADIPTEWKNFWLALDQVGDVAQRFAQELKHDLTKKGLGLPRNVRPPLKGSFRPTGPMQSGERHSSPTWFHIARDRASGKLVVRVTAFPARYLPDPAASRELLGRLLDHTRNELPNRVQAHRAAGQPVNPPAPGGGAPSAARPVAALKTGSRVAAMLVEDPKKKGRLFAQVKDGALVGPIQNANEVPTDARAVGTALTLEIASISSDGRQIAFRWPRGTK